MKSYVIPAVIILIISLSAVSVSAFTAENLIQNGGFENVDSSGFPLNWDSAGKNLIPDPSFENGGWSLSGNGGAANLTIVQDKARTGSKSAKISYKSAQLVPVWAAVRCTPFFSDPKSKIVINAGEKYIFRSFLNITGLNGPADNFAMISVEMFDSNGTKRVSEGGNPSGANLKYSQNTPVGGSGNNNEWTEHAVEVTIPLNVGQNGRLTSISARTNGAYGMTAYFDDISIEKLSGTDAAVKYTGEKSLKIIGYNGGYFENSTGPVEDSFYTGAAVNGTFQYSYKLKAPGNSGNAFIRFTFLNSNGTAISEIEGEKFSNISGWNTVSDEITPPSGTVSARISLVVTPGMTAWFDDITVSEISPEFNLSELFMAGGTPVTASVTLTNEDNMTKNVSVITALYNKSGVLQNTGINEEIINPNETKTVTASLTLPGFTDEFEVENYYVRAFVWDSAAGLVPIGNQTRLDGMKVTAVIEPDYLTAAQIYYDGFTRNFTETAAREQVLANNVTGVCDFMASLAVMYTVTDDVKYLNMCKQTWDTVLTEWRLNNSLMRGTDDFFAPAQFLKACKLLKDTGRIGTENDDLIIKFTDGIVKNNFIADHNQAQVRALAGARLYNLFPDSPEGVNLKNYSDVIWNLWYQNKDVDEDAANYASIHLRDIIYIAMETGREDLLLDAEIKKWFERYRDQLAPSGFMPEYGDDYFYSYHLWPFIYEYAAKIYNDASFTTAARKVFWTAYRNKITDSSFSKTAFNMSLAYEWSTLAEPLIIENRPQTAAAIKAGTKITKRTNLYNIKNIPDQLLLGVSREPGAPFVMADLYGNGSHGHSTQRGNILYYEAGNIPFFHGLNRRSIDPRQANTVVLTANNQSGEFPFDCMAGNGTNPNRAVTNTWYTDKADLSGLPDSVDGTKGFKNIIFRFKSNLSNGGMTIYIKNVVLEGIAGTDIADACDSAAKWSNGAEVYTDPLSGEKSIKITLTGNEVKFVNLNISKSFNLSSYDALKVEWKHELADSGEISGLWTVFRFTYLDAVVTQVGENRYLDYTPACVSSRGYVSSASVSTSGKDSYGEYQILKHFTNDTALRRKLLLTEEGILIIQDYLLPGADAEGYTAGSVWNLYTLEKQGENWFNSAGEKLWYGPLDENPLKNKELLVYYENAPGRSYGFQTGDFAMKPKMAFSKTTVTSGNPVCFLTVLVPHDSETAAETIAAGITAETTGQNSAVTINLNNKVITANINGDGSYSIVRN